MSCPTPALMLELDYVFGYLVKQGHRSIGITYDSGLTQLEGCSDASFETFKSTSGWSIQWQKNVTISWGSRRHAPAVRRTVVDGG